MNGPSSSFWQSAWRRLKKNKGAMAGLVLIFLAILTALFSYLIAPDPTPFGNRIILEIGGEKPGYTRDFLRVKKVQPQTASFITRVFNGSPDRFDFIPIISWNERGDSLQVEKYIDEDFLPYETVWAAAGTPNAIFELQTEALQKMTAGKVVRVK